MAFEEIKENAEDLKQQARELLDANIQYYKLLGLKIVMKSATGAIKGILLLVLGLKILLFLSLAAALGIGYWLNNFAYGFLIVGGIYIVLALFAARITEKIVEGSILAKVSDKFFNNSKAD